ncbi:ABC transporter ATP-binding protein [Streptomyces sp. C]|nr:ABC transporter ATP-binding protein [Streptomyces sp. C]
MLELKGITAGYDRRGPVVRDAHLALHSGEALGLLGPSGCGKSTLARVAALLHRPDRGTVAFDGRAVTELPAPGPALPAHRSRRRLPAAPSLRRPPPQPVRPRRGTAPRHGPAYGGRSGRRRAGRPGRPGRRPARPAPPRGQRRPAPARLPGPGAGAAAALAGLRRDDRDARRLHHRRSGRGGRGVPEGDRSRPAGRRARPGAARPLVRPHGALERHRGQLINCCAFVNHPARPWTPRAVRSSVWRRRDVRRNVNNTEEQGG